MSYCQGCAALESQLAAERLHSEQVHAGCHAERDELAGRVAELEYNLAARTVRTKNAEAKVEELAREIATELRPQVGKNILHAICRAENTRLAAELAQARAADPSDIRAAGFLVECHHALNAIEGDDVVLWDAVKLNDAGLIDDDEITCGGKTHLEALNNLRAELRQRGLLPASGVEGENG